MSKINNAIVVLDVRNLMDFNVNTVAVFAGTAEGRTEAEKQFEGWIKESEPTISDGELQEALDMGKREIGEGGIFFLNS